MFKINLEVEFRVRQSYTLIHTATTENLKSVHVQSNRPILTGTLDTTQTGPSCRVWRAM